MISVRLYTGEVLEFPDNTPEAVMRRVAEEVTSGEFDRKRGAQRNGDGAGGTMDLSDLRREPDTFDLSRLRRSGGTDGQPVPAPAPPSPPSPPSMLTLEEKRRQMAVARERGDLGAMQDPYADTSSIGVAARQIIPRIKENLIAQVEAPSLARTATLPLGPLLGPPAARALDRVLPEVLRGRTTAPAPLEEMRGGAAEDVERAKEELRESMAVRGAPPLATAATQFGFGAEAMALDPLNLAGAGVGTAGARAGRVGQEAAEAVAPRLARASEFDDLARASLDIGASPQTAQIPVQVVDAGSEGVIRRIAALDDAGNEVGSMTYSAEPNGGFRVMDIGTGVRGSGADRAMMRHASQDANGPYLGSFAETDPDIFPEQSISRLPDNDYNTGARRSMDPTAVEVYKAALNSTTSDMLAWKDGLDAEREIIGQMTLPEWAKHREGYFRQTGEWLPEHPAEYLKRQKDGFVATYNSRLGALRKAEESIFGARGPMLPPEPVQMSRIAAAEREEFLRPPVPFAPAERGSIGPPGPPTPAPLPSDIPEHLRPQLPEEQVAEAMGWKIPEGSPRAVGPSTRLPEFQTNIPAQLGDDPQITNYVIQRSDEVYAAIGPPQTWDTLEEMATRLGMSKEDFLSRPSHWSVMSPEARLRMMHIANGDMELKIRPLQAKIVEGTATDADKAELLRLIDNQEDFIKLGASSASAYARALNSAKIEARLLLTGDQQLKQQLYRQYSKQLDAEKPLMSVLARLDPNKPEELRAFLRAVNKPKWYEYAHEYWIGSILSGFGPHINNALGNTLNTFMENAVVRPVAAGFDLLRVTGPGAALNAEREVFLRETPQALVGLVHGIRGGARAGWEVMRRGYDATAMQGKLFPHRSAFARSQNRIVREVIGPVVTMPLRALAASDTMMKAMNWSAELYAQAARIASKEGLAGQEFANRMAHLVKNPTDEMRDAADAFALKATFNDPASAVGKAFINMRDLPNAQSANPAMQKAIETWRLAGGFILPFIKIADRLMVRGLEYTPLGYAPMAGARMTGNFAEAATYAAKASIGTSILTYVASLAAEGRITASVPQDEAEKAAFYNANKKPWSVQTDDGRWIPFNQMQPIAMPFAFVAAAWEGWTKHEEAPTEERLGHAAGRIGSYMVDQSYMRGFSDFVDIIHGSEQGQGRKFSTFVANTTWGFTTYSGMVRSLNRAIDPRLVDAETIAEKIKQNIPGVSLGMEAKVTVWGEDVTPAGGRMRAIIPPSSVLASTQETPDPFDDELARLGMPLGYVGKSIADKFPEDRSSRGEWQLSKSEQHLYQKVAGRTTRLMLGVLFNEMPEYQSWDIESQRDEVQKVIDASRKYARILMVRYRRGQGIPDATPTWEEVSSELQLGSGELY